ncbi:hypothetical protein LFU01_32120 [Lysinibacillus fusiformis]|nr:hypothetical protein LFU01_32120 [Lysinibacillus fusiformis]
MSSSRKKVVPRSLTSLGFIPKGVFFASERLVPNWATVILSRTLIDLAILTF